MSEPESASPNSLPERFSSLHATEKLGVIETMTRFGGSFVQGLADLWLRGDNQNRETLENAFLYFDQYVVTFRVAQVQTRGDLARLTGIPDPRPQSLAHPWADDYRITDSSRDGDELNHTKP